jgi:pSer/pThr/pTyr-binding forkhead associated (FHA) protein
MSQHRLRRMDDGQEFALEGEVTIGRDPGCDIVLDSKQVSRHHATVSVTDGGVFVTDDRSTNGIEVAGKRSSRASLSHGQLIQIGDVVLCFLHRDESSDPTVVSTKHTAPRVSFVVDEGSGDVTSYRGEYAPLPGADQTTAPVPEPEEHSEQSDRLVLSALVKSRGLSSDDFSAVLMPLAGKAGQLHLLTVRESADWRLGRDADNDVVLDHHSISAHHARLECDSRGWSLTDLGSTNGTRCNGKTGTRFALNPGDVLRLGDAAFLFDVIDPD